MPAIVEKWRIIVLRDFDMCSIFSIFHRKIMRDNKRNGRVTCMYVCSKCTRYAGQARECLWLADRSYNLPPPAGIFTTSTVCTRIYEMIVLGTTKLPSRWRYFIGPFKSWSYTLRAHVGNGISWRVGYFLYHFQSDKNLEFFLYYNFTKIVTGSTRMLGSNRSSSARKPKKSTSR